MIQARETELLLPSITQANSGTGNFRAAVTRFFSSGRILKALSFASGLHDPRKEGFWGAVFTVALLVTDLALFVLALLFNVICPVIDYKVGWLCSGVDSTNFLEISTNRFLFLMTSVTAVASHAAFFFCFLNLDKGEHTIKPNRDAFVLNKHSFWLKINLILVLGLVPTSVMISEHTLTVTYVWFAISNISVLRSIVNCCLFGMVMLALKDCVKKCEEEINNLHSDDINDAMVIHQRLCARVFSTSDTLKPWFIINWLAAVFWSVFFAGNITNILHSWYAMSIVCLMCITLFVFLYPCYIAASVTSKCRQILTDMNMRTKDDWPPGHPLKQRGQLLQFIQYADYTQCGYRVGNAVFGSSFAWISTLMALSIGAVKFLYSK